MAPTAAQTAPTADVPKSSPTRSPIGTANSPASGGKRKAEDNKRRGPDAHTPSKKIEAELAGYLGYDVTADMHRFILSSNFLRYFFKYAGKWFKGLHRTGALEQTRDQFLKGKKNDFPIDYGEARKHYPADVQVVAAAQKAHMTELQALRPKVCDNMPELSNKMVKLPKLKTEHEKSELEQYNRAYNLLKYLAHHTSLSNIFVKKFEHPKWQEDKLVDGIHIPTWMQGKPESSASVETPEPKAHEVLSRTSHHSS